MPFDFSQGPVKPAEWNIRKDLLAEPEAWEGIGDGAVYLFYGNAQDAYRGADGTNQGANLDAVGIAGGGAVFTGSDRIEIPDAVADAIAVSGTVAICWTHDGGTTDGSFFDSRAGLNDGWDININVNGTGSFNVLIDTGELAIASVDITGLGVELVAAVARYDGTNVLADVSGAGSASAELEGTASRSTSPPKIGNIVADSIPLGSGRILHFMFISERVWSDAEVESFLDDPFSRIRADPAKIIPVYMSEEAAAGGGFFARRYYDQHLGAG